MRRFLLRLYNAVSSRRAEHELARELASHLALLEDELRRQGMTADEARLAARRAIGGIEHAKDRHRDARSFGWLEDLTSDAFLALHRNLDGIDQAQLPGWLLTVVRNRARDLWRKRMVEQRYVNEIVEAPPRPVPPAPPLEGWIVECRDLRPVHRTCLILRYVHGMTRAEIAAETGLNEMQVKGHLQYALTLLRKAYGVGRA